MPDIYVYICLVVQLVGNMYNVVYLVHGKCISNEIIRPTQLFVYYNTVRIGETINAFEVSIIPQVKRHLADIHVDGGIM